MSLLDALRAGIKVADDVTKPLQATVTYKAWIGSIDAYGTPSYAAPISLKCVVEQSVSQRRTASGRLVMTKATLTFPYPVPANGAVGRVEPIDTRDIIILPDGTSGSAFNPNDTTTPMGTAQGVVDALTGRPLYTEIYLI